MRAKIDEKSLVSLDGYENKWVALSNDEKKIIASDDSFEKAAQKAIRKGEDHPVLLKVPSKIGSYILFSK